MNPQKLHQKSQQSYQKPQSGASVHQQSPRNRDSKSKLVEFEFKANLGAFGYIVPQKIGAIFKCVLSYQLEIICISITYEFFANCV